jgi:catechol 2,3-dioxygenase-like lactoylglutathione lyase family enzyme
MIDHAAVNVTDLERGKAFYSQALRPLGYSLMFEAGEFLGFGKGEMPSFGVVRRDPTGGGHVAFAADDRPTVDAFYEAAMAAGGSDNGPPGVREHYSSPEAGRYYAAFLFDPDGNNVEAVRREEY